MYIYMSLCLHILCSLQFSFQVGHLNIVFLIIFLRNVSISFSEIFFSQIQFLVYSFCDLDTWYDHEISLFSVFSSYDLDSCVSTSVLLLGFSSYDINISQLLYLIFRYDLDISQRLYLVFSSCDLNICLSWLDIHLLCSWLHFFPSVSFTLCFYNFLSQILSFNYWTLYSVSDCCKYVFLIQSLSSLLF